jgi:cyclomaltodextrinase
MSSGGRSTRWGSWTRRPTAQPEVVHRLPRLQNWLDYLIELGASGLALGPIFASASHGYDTVDYFRIDPRLGDEQDFRDLVDAAHSKGIRVLLDGVFNHVGRTSPPSARGAASGSTCTPVVSTNTSRVTAISSPSTTIPRSWWTSWSMSCATGWSAGRGRLAPRRRLRDPGGVLGEVLPRVRERFPQAYIVGEMIHGDYSAYVQEAGLDAVTQYELWKAIWSSLNDRNLFELNWTLGSGTTSSSSSSSR